MKIRLTVLLIVIFGFWLGSSLPTKGQRLYDEGRDKKAQEAASQAKEIRNNSTFEHQLKNVDTFSKRSAEVYFRGAERQMNLNISGFRSWGRVVNIVQGIRRTLEAEDFISSASVAVITSDMEKKCPRTTELGKAICDAQQELARSKAAITTNKKNDKDLEKELENRLATIGDIEALANKAESFLKADSHSNKAIKGFTEVFINLSRAFANFNNKLSTISNDTPDELKLLLEKVALEVLQVEVDHWTTVGEIQLRRVNEQEDLIDMARQFENRMQTIAFFYMCIDPSYSGKPYLQRAQMLSGEGPDVILTKLWAHKPGKTCTVKGNAENREAMMAFVIQTLHLAAALSARGETPAKLTAQRLAQEEHRLSIRQSAVVARGYEAVLTSGTDRLARYYAGGIKPDKIAQFIHTAATLAIPFVIAGK